MKKAQNQNLFAETLSNLIDEGALLQPKDHLFAHIDRFLKSQLLAEIEASENSQVLIFLNKKATLSTKNLKSNKVLTTPFSKELYFINEENGKYSLVSVVENNYKNKSFPSKDLNFISSHIETDKKRIVLRKKLSAKKIQSLSAQLQVLLIGYSLGMLEALQNSVVHHAHQRKSNGAPLMTYQNISYRLVDNLLQLSKLRTMLMYCNNVISSDQISESLLSMLIYLHDQTHQVVIDSAMQIFGAVAMRAESLPGRTIRKSLVLRALVGNKNESVAVLKKHLLRKKVIKKMKNIYSVEGF